MFYLNHLLEKFVPFLPEDMREIYTTHQLQQKLEKHFGDAIVIQCQQGQGMSNIVYSSSICLSEAIDKANRLKADMKSIRTHDLSDASSSVCDEDLILHKALDVKKFSNFGDLAIFYLKHLSMLLQSAEIVDVFDRYDLKDSIKSAERERRSQAAGGHRIYHVNEGSSIPDWKKFLSINRNKQELISFLGEFISKFVNANNPLPVGQTLYLAGTFRNPEALSSIICEILPAVHALTGCDTTSAIFGIGKQSVFKLINSSSAELSDLSQLKDPDLESSLCVARKVVQSCMTQKQSISLATPI